MSGTSLLSGVMLLAMGGWALTASRSGGMRAVSSGWQANLLLDMQDLGHRITRSLSWLPPWAAWLAFAAIVAGFATVAVRQLRHPELPPRTAGSDTTDPAAYRATDTEPASRRTLEETRT